MIVKEIKSENGGTIYIHDDYFEDEHSVKLRKQNIKQILMNVHKRRVAEARAKQAS